MKISVLIQVWNEARCLPCSLPALVAVMDEVVISNGGPHGPSTDGTKAIIDEMMESYPEKIIYIEGTHAKEDGSWDEVAQVDEGLSHITGDYMMRTSADILIDECDLLAMRSIVERFPEKKLFYSPMIDFGGDTDHIILPGCMMMEDALQREVVQNDGHIWNMSGNPHAVAIGDNKRFGMVSDIDYQTETLYMPHVKRFHYGYVKPFGWLVEKFVGQIRTKEHGDWEALLAAGEQAMYAEAINWVRELKSSLPVQPYTGTYPVSGEPLRSMDVMDGYEEFMRSYLVAFVGEHARPNVPGWTEREPTESEINTFNEARMPPEQPALTIEGIGMNPIESFLAGIIEHFYPSANAMDVGCGNGKFISALLFGGHIASGVGIDASATMVQNAQQTADNVGVQAAFAVRTLEHMDSTTRFDVIIAKDLLEHLYNVNQGLDTLGKMLIEDGLLCGSVPLWDACDCDAHLHHFTSESLSILLGRFLKK